MNTSACVARRVPIYTPIADHRCTVWMSDFQKKLSLGKKKNIEKDRKKTVQNTGLASAIRSNTRCCFFLVFFLYCGQTRQVVSKLLYKEFGAGKIEIRIRGQR